MVCFFCLAVIPEEHEHRHIPEPRCSCVPCVTAPPEAVFAALRREELLAALERLPELRVH